MLGMVGLYSVAVSLYSTKRTFYVYAKSRMSDRAFGYIGPRMLIVSLLSRTFVLVRACD